MGNLAAIVGVRCAKQFLFTICARATQNLDEGIHIVQLMERLWGGIPNSRYTFMIAALSSCWLPDTPR
jgi:hypothetical protein